MLMMTHPIKCHRIVHSEIHKALRMLLESILNVTKFSDIDFFIFNHVLTIVVSNNMKPVCLLNCKEDKEVKW